ncbi:hypothetical protein [Vulcanisaeta souniana]|uniref:hypothetical protein n=1 Tax=Vulcanisaeta souniana TaxID=164452 RepID=UPI0006D129D1|nr:hypothetical protein [Vulcanisaeta souniana]
MRVLIGLNAYLKPSDEGFLPYWCIVLARYKSVEALVSEPVTGIAWLILRPSLDPPESIARVVGASGG